MSDDAYTRDVFEQLTVPPESAQFFGELAERMRQRERDATKRWKRTAIVFAVVALAATAAAGVLAVSPAAATNTVDVTVQCANLAKGGIPVFSVDTAPTGKAVPKDGHLPAPPPGFHPANGISVETGDVAYILAMTNFAAGYQLDRRACVPDKTKVSLGPGGMPKQMALKNGDAEHYLPRCLGPGKILMRFRIQNDRFGAPAHVQLLIAKARNREPMIYLDWTPTAVTAWGLEACNRP